MNGGGMFGDDDQNQGTSQGAGDSGQVDAVGPSSTGSLSSFTMDPPHKDDQAAMPSEPTTAPPADTSLPEPATNDSPAPAADTSKDESSPAADSELLEIKKQALGQLSPLVSHLDQSPEEKFKTLMMMIQASDDKSLIKQAHDIAQQIPDEKAKAQALLDIVNEINYFTQQPDD